MNHLQARGEFFISPGAEVYEGMIVGEHCPSDADVNFAGEEADERADVVVRQHRDPHPRPASCSLEHALEYIDR